MVVNEEIKSPTSEFQNMRSMIFLSDRWSFWALIKKTNCEDLFCLDYQIRYFQKLSNDIRFTFKKLADAVMLLHFRQKVNHSKIWNLMGI